MNRRFIWLMAVLISLAALADLMLMRVLRMTGVTGRFLEYLMFAALLLIPYPIARSRRLPRVQHMVVLLITVLLSNCTLSVLIVLAGRANAPLIDGVLAGIDRSFGFSIGAVVKWIGQSPMLFSGSWLLYRTLAPIVILPIFVLPMRGLERVGQRYVLSVSVAAILTAGIFALFPAIGPWTVYGFKPTVEQATYHRYFVDALRSQVTADVSYGLSGVVTFPSFHCVLAILSGIAMWRVPYLRYVVAAISAGICVSTMTTGWHYLTDALGAVLVVLVAHSVAHYALNTKDASALKPSTAVSESEPYAEEVKS